MWYTFQTNFREIKKKFFFLGNIMKEEFQLEELRFFKKITILKNWWLSAEISFERVQKIDLLF